MIRTRCLPVGQLQANCWLLWDDSRRAIVIDPGDEPLRILRALQEENLFLQQILLTHVHVDHMLAVPDLQRATGAPLAVHTDDAPALTDGTKSLTTHFGTSCLLTADRLLNEGDVVMVGDMRVTVWHTPGHTPGSCCYHVENCLFTGDTLFAGSVGRTDLPGGNYHTLRNSLRRLAAYPDNLQLFPGHEGVSNLAYEQQNNFFLSDG